MFRKSKRYSTDTKPTLRNYLKNTIRKKQDKIKLKESDVKSEGKFEVCFILR